ncbi:DUF305 domain-containing protein [Streptomyces sp. 3MP-14]|uniref:DUF305 domain-containing protein n=1 Tax=Streptomyces mimosae TaxID=2586635 RepID=A0A5N5ZWW1_9ACTN|nr:MULTISPECIES: DUF305 domain-containing protein [Streptomyces]KAB8160259.1 DUF305 domain-containing protein [Streptomyces mimosae]KAB8172979.1 DUF305 domain-containing protein [Streptomyces sp. 3MP-14]
MTDRPRAASRRSSAVFPLLVAALVAGWGLTACSGDDGASASEEGPGVIAPGAPGEDAETLSPEEAAERVPEPGEPDAADIGYLHRMVDHHGQALQMSELALERAENDAVRGIAERITASQGPEIEVMRAWLDDRGVADGEEHGGHGDHGGDHGEHGGTGEAMPGMATPEELAELAEAEGAAFDALFLELMTRHHEGAVTMAAEVLGTTTDQTVEQLATDVIATQNAEIDRMAALA